MSTLDLNSAYGKLLQKLRYSSTYGKSASLDINDAYGKSVQAK